MKFVDLHVAVPRKWAVGEARRLCDKLEGEILAVLQNTQARPGRSGLAFFRLFPVDAVNQAAVDGLLDFLLGGPVGIENFGQDVIIHADCLRNGFRTEPTAQTVFLGNIRFSWHVCNPPVSCG
jgi:hypothetical protein